jgi:hypothetical protein
MPRYSPIWAMAEHLPPLFVYKPGISQSGGVSKIFMIQASSVLNTLLLTFLWELDYELGLG